MTPEELRDAIQEALDWHAIRERRAQFVAAVLQGLSACPRCHEQSGYEASAFAHTAVEFADAAIARLNSQEPSPSDALKVIKAQHQAIDTLFAILIEKTKGDEPHCFFPSESGQPWEACKAGHALIVKLEGRI